MIKTGSRVLTEHGYGTIIGTDAAGFSDPNYRYKVELDDKERFGFTPCYWPKELKEQPHD